MTQNAIKVENLCKSYLLGRKSTGAEQYNALRDTIVHNARNFAKKAQNIFRGKSTLAGSGSEEFWALKDINFEIRQGDRVGIIGRNGAGKSTLLKILSRITEPTSGRLLVNGRVSSLLEVGTGFHPELTGRENIFLNGAILGMSRREILHKFDEIVAFAEVERFLDTAVKRYSSGMYVRLAFAVAAHLEPEVLVVDEVLAVGDAQFQKKCLGKMNDVASEGRTILFVSHNMTAVSGLCTKGMLLDAGRLTKVGSTEEVIAEYLQSGQNNLLVQIWNDLETAPGNEKFKLHSVRVLNVESPEQTTFSVNSSIDIEFSGWVLEQGLKISFNFSIVDSMGQCVFNIASEPKLNNIGILKATCHVPANFMNDGTYSINLMILDFSNDIQCICRINEAALFEVVDIIRDSSWSGKWPGVVRPTCFTWEVQMLDGNP